LLNATFIQVRTTDETENGQNALNLLMCKRQSAANLKGMDLPFGATLGNAWF
jgi:hypothetical protein